MSLDQQTAGHEDHDYPVPKLTVQNVDMALECRPTGVPLTLEDSTLGWSAQTYRGRLL
jgi:hypothetical protein